MARPRRDEKISVKSRLIGSLLYYAVWLVSKTWRVTVVKHPEYDDKSQYIFAFWHGNQILPGAKFARQRPGGTMLVSPSRDGDIATVCLQKLGYVVVRGSSRDGNVQGLAQMMRRFKQGFSLGFSIDGPIGPRHKVKPGAIFVAQKLNASIVPFGSYCEKSWTLSRSWDKTCIPKPFTKAIFYIGKPIVVPAEMDVEQGCVMVENGIQYAQQQAQTLL